MTLWVCRAGRYGEYENHFLDKKIIAITWGNLKADLTKPSSWDEFKDVLKQQYPDCSKNQIANFAGQLYPFVNTMKVGEKVILPSKINPGRLYVGIIEGDCQYNGDKDQTYTHIRKVKWDKKYLERNQIDADIRHSLNSTQTIYSIRKEKEDRLFAVNHGVPKGPEEESVDEDYNLVDASNDQIKTQLIQKFKGMGMQDVIESIFKAKGYTTINTTGADKGIDVLASNGPLGFGGTKICIQVKTQESPVDIKVFNELNGAMSKVNADYGLLVSWYGFRSSLDSERRDSFFKVRLWDSNDILREFLENYDNLDEDIKQKVPLKRIWILDRQFEPD